MVRKQKQKQKQSQNVIVNVNAPRKSPRKRSAKSKPSSRPPPRPPPAPNFPIGPRSDPFIPREYKQPSLSDIITAIQTVKQPVTQSIQKEKETVKEPFVPEPFAPRSISSVLSKVGDTDIGFIAQNPTIVRDIARGALGFGTEPNPQALQSVAPPPAPPSTLERTRPTENPFKFVDASPTLSVASSRPTRENFDTRKKSLTEIARSLVPDTETFIPPTTFQNPPPLFINSEFRSAPPYQFGISETKPLLPVLDYGIVPETQTFIPFFPTALFEPITTFDPTLLQPINFVGDEDVPEIEEFVDASGEEPIEVEPIITQGPTPELGPLLPTREEGSFSLVDVPPPPVPAPEQPFKPPPFAYAYTSSESERDDERFKSSRKRPPRSEYVPVPTEPFSVTPLPIETESQLPEEQRDVTKRPAPPIPPPPPSVTRPRREFEPFVFPPPPPTPTVFGTERPEFVPPSFPEQQTESPLLEEQPDVTENEAAKKLFRDTVKQQRRAIREAKTFVPPPLPEQQTEYRLLTEQPDVTTQPLTLTAPLPNPFKASLLPDEEPIPNFEEELPGTAPASQIEFIEPDAPTPRQFAPIRVPEPYRTEQLTDTDLAYKPDRLGRTPPPSPPKTPPPEAERSGIPVIREDYFRTSSSLASGGGGAPPPGRIDFSQFKPATFERRLEKKRRDGDPEFVGKSDQELIDIAERLREEGKQRSAEKAKEMRGIRAEDKRIAEEERARSTAVSGATFTPEQLAKPRQVVGKKGGLTDYSFS